MPDQPHRDHYGDQAVALSPGRIGENGAADREDPRRPFALNLVNAWNRPERAKAGIGFAEHDERYAYGHEWISVASALLRAILKQNSDPKTVVHQTFSKFAFA